MHMPVAGFGLETAICLPLALLFQFSNIRFVNAAVSPIPQFCCQFVQAFINHQFIEKSYLDRVYLWFQTFTVTQPNE
jgi:hypothetical protein